MCCNCSTTAPANLRSLSVAQQVIVYVAVRYNSRKMDLIEKPHFEKARSSVSVVFAGKGAFESTNIGLPLVWDCTGTRLVLIA